MTSIEDIENVIHHPRVEIRVHVWKVFEAENMHGMTHIAV